jgi:hypothetical protein
MSSSFPVHTVEDIIAAFRLKDNKITPIEGTPTLQTLLRAHNELLNASIKIWHCARGNFGYLYLTELPVVYATWQPNIPYVPPINPGDTPNLTTYLAMQWNKPRLNGHTIVSRMCIVSLTVWSKEISNTQAYRMSPLLFH